VSLTPTDLLGDAWRQWRRERTLLLAVAGPFVFLPSYAMALLVTAAPAMPERGAPQVEVLTWLNQFSDWAAANSPWYLLQFAITYFGVFTMLILLLDPRRPTVGEAMRQAGRRLPRYLLATFAIGMAASAGLILFVLPGVYIMARTVGVGPALATDPHLSAAGAISRSVALTRGHVLLLMGVILMLWVGGWIAEQPLAAVDHWLRDGAEPNPVARAIVDAALAGVATAIALATLLVQVAAFQRLGGTANSGT